MFEYNVINRREHFIMSRMILNSIRNDYNEDVDKKREFDKSRKYFDMSEKSEYTLDDQTWDDLDMDKVYSKLDRAYSTPGEAALYSMLRNPLLSEDKVKERGRLIKLLKEDNKLRDSLQCIFFDLNRDYKNCLLDMLDQEVIVNKAKYYIYTLLGKIIPLIIIFLAIFVSKSYMIALLGISSINMLINSSEVKEIKSNGIFYLRKNIVAAKKIASINNKGIIYYKQQITSMLKSVKGIERSTRLIGVINMWGGFLNLSL